MATIHLYSTISNEHRTIKGNGKLKDILPSYDWEKSIVIKQGERISPDVDLKSEDVIYIRETPGSTTAIAVIAIVSAVVAVGVGIGASIYANKKSEETKAKMEKAQRDAENLANSVETLPFLKGAKNKVALGNSIQYIMGEMFNTPYLLTNGFYSLGGTNGNKQFWNVILDAGYGEQLIKSLSVGSVKIKDFDETEPQNASYSFPTNNIYYDADNIIEIAQGHNLTNQYFNKKVIAVADGTELKHEYGESAEPVIKQLAENPKKVEACIQFNGLRAYNTNTSNWESRTVRIRAEWSNNNGASWHDMPFNFPNSSSWNLLSDNDVQALINNGTISVEDLSVVYTKRWTINSSSYKFADSQPSDITKKSDKNAEGTFGGIYKLPKVLQYNVINNAVTMNTRSTVRFIATHEFTWAETHDQEGNELPIIVRFTKETPKLESNSNEDCFLMYYNTFCYDAKKSNATVGLVDCKPLEDWYSSKSTLIGFRIAANSQTQEIIDEINLVSSGVARVWDSDTKTWSENKIPTRNPASWILELLTSDVHPHSKYDDEEINLLTLGELYEYCEEEEFYTDAILTSGAKKRDIISGILSTIFADMLIDNDGRLTFVIDKKESTPVALINSQNVRSTKVAKSFERKPDGMKINFTNRNAWKIDTMYSMLDGGERTQDDILSEMSIEYATTPEHVYKIAQRKMRKEVLQPIEITADVGKEGDFYPLHSTILLQMKQLKRGLADSVIKNLKIEGQFLSEIIIGDTVEFESGKEYGIVVFNVTATEKRELYIKVHGSGRTNILELVDPISINETLPLVDAVVSFGELDEDGEFTKVTNTMKICGMERNGDNGIALKLRDYNEAIYEYGTIPEYKTNLTSKPNSTENKINDVAFRESISGLTEEITNTVAQTVQPIKTLTSIASAEGYPEGTLGLFENKFFKVIGGKWIALDTNNYLGARYSIPESAGLGAYFLAKVNFTKVMHLSTSARKPIDVIHGGVRKHLAVVRKLVKNSLYERTENGWKEITDKGDYRYIIAMGDIIANGGELPYYIEEGMVDAVPVYLGANSSLPSGAKKGDWFAYVGDTTEHLVKGNVYYYNGVDWLEDTNTDHKTGALNDLLDIASQCGSEMFANVIAAKLSVNEAFINSLVSNEAFIDTLTVKKAIVKDKGFIKSENYNGTIDENGIITKFGDVGYAMDNNGKSDFVNINATGGNFDNVSVSGFFEVTKGMVSRVISYSGREGYSQKDMFDHFYEVAHEKSVTYMATGGMLISFNGGAINLNVFSISYGEGSFEVTGMGNDSVLYYFTMFSNGSSQINSAGGRQPFSSTLSTHYVTI